MYLFGLYTLSPSSTPDCFIYETFLRGNTACKTCLQDVTLTVMKLTEEMKRLVREDFASKGGKARAKKYDKKTLSKWAKKGGRPKKRSGSKDKH